MPEPNDLAKIEFELSRAHILSNPPHQNGYFRRSQLHSIDEPKREGGLNARQTSSPVRFDFTVLNSFSTGSDFSQPFSLDRGGYSVHFFPHLPTCARTDMAIGVLDGCPFMSLLMIHYARCRDSF